MRPFPRIDQQERPALPLPGTDPAGPSEHLLDHGHLDAVQAAGGVGDDHGLGGEVDARGDGGGGDQDVRLTGSEGLLGVPLVGPVLVVEPHPLPWCTAARHQMPGALPYDGNGSRLGRVERRMRQQRGPLGGHQLPNGHVRIAVVLRQHTASRMMTHTRQVRLRTVGTLWPHLTTLHGWASAGVKYNQPPTAAYRLHCC